MYIVQAKKEPCRHVFFVSTLSTDQNEHELSSYAQAAKEYPVSLGRDRYESPIPRQCEIMQALCADRLCQQFASARLRKTL